MSKSNYTRQMLTMLRKQVLQSGSAPPRNNKYKMVDGRLIYAPKSNSERKNN